MAGESEKLGLKELVAIGVGSMIGGGIFSVMGMAEGIAGTATPLVFILGGIIAMLAGYNYAKLALTFREDGASYTYIKAAFPAIPYISGLAGWSVWAISGPWLCMPIPSEPMGRPCWGKRAATG